MTIRFALLFTAAIVTVFVLVLGPLYWLARWITYESWRDEQEPEP